jgi:hypothetical protein
MNVGITRVNKGANLDQIMASVAKMEVYVGIPEETTDRPDTDLTNAQILFLNTHGVRKGSMIKDMNKDVASGLTYGAALSLYITSKGSPLWHVPPRPLIEPAIEAKDNRDMISEILGEAVKAVLARKPDEARLKLHEAGQVAVNCIMAWFDDPRNEWPPLSPVTIAARKGHSDLPLQDTGELSKSIRYVIGEKA